jgi:hypothetical protein
LATLVANGERGDGKPAGNPVVLLACRAGPACSTTLLLLLF